MSAPERADSADVIVVGASAAGMAVAARLAKLGRRVLVLEREELPGGRLRRLSRDGFAWSTGPTSTSLPGVWRDLFRKSGRPIERYVDLRMRTIARRHVFPDGSIIDLPTGSRGAQIAAVDRGLGTGLGRQWAEFVDGQAERWQLLRSEVLDPPRGGERLLGDRRLARRLGAQKSLRSVLRESMPDARLQAMVSLGADPATVPGLAAIEPYVERTFGVWETTSGLADLVEALTTRLRERRVELRPECTVTSVTHDDAGRVRGVRLASGEIVRAPFVVAAIDKPTDLLEHDAASSRPHSPEEVSRITLLGLDGEGLPQLPAEVVLHGYPTLVLTTGGAAPPLCVAWSIRSLGPLDGDILDTLAARGLDVRDRVARRIDRSSSSPPTRRGHGRTASALLGRTARALPDVSSVELGPGLLSVGPVIRLGSPLPYSVWAAASVATLIGRPSGAT